ncbi:hypothetical protein D3C73_986250 [compost metagenome]
MVGAQMRGDGLGVLRLVVAFLVEADGEGAHRLGALRLHQRHDGGRINAARQEGAQADVGQHLAAHCLGQHAFQRLGGLGVGPKRQRRLGRAIGGFARGPIHARLRHAAAAGVVGGEFHPGARGQLGDALVDGLRRRNVVVAHERGQRVAVQLAAESGDGHEALQLGRKHQLGARIAVVQRLFAHAVARQHQLARRAVPQRNGEHADCGLQSGFDAQRGEAGQQRFGIGMAAPGRRQP